MQVTKVILKQDGTRAHAAVLTVMNEHCQTLLQVPTQTKSLDEVMPALQQLASNIHALGLPVSAQLLHRTLCLLPAVFERNATCH